MLSSATARKMASHYSVSQNRLGGKFISSAKLKWRSNVNSALENKRKLESSLRRKAPVSGRRIVEIDSLADNLWCKSCELPLSLKNVVKETRFGLASGFIVKCLLCSKFYNVHTSKSSNNFIRHSVYDINLKTALAVLDGGIGISQLNTMLSAMNIPVMSDTTFKRHERLVGRAIERVANKSCIRAIQKEVEMTELAERSQVTSALPVQIQGKPSMNAAPAPSGESTFPGGPVQSEEELCEASVSFPIPFTSPLRETQIGQLSTDATLAPSEPLFSAEPCHSGEEICDASVSPISLAESSSSGFYESFSRSDSSSIIGSSPRMEQSSENSCWVRNLPHGHDYIPMGPRLQDDSRVPPVKKPTTGPSSPFNTGNSASLQTSQETPALSETFPFSTEPPISFSTPLRSVNSANEKAKPDFQGKNVCRLPEVTCTNLGTLSALRSLAPACRDDNISEVADLPNSLTDTTNMHLVNDQHSLFETPRQWKYVKASVDGAWQKRGTGRSYDSRTGHVSVIGYESKKIIGYATRQKGCAQCERGHDPSDHDCRKNHTGSSKCMEAEMAADIVNNNPNFDKENVRIGTLIADDDASTIHQVRRGASHEVKKWSDLNHATGCFVKAIRKVPSVKDQQTIDHLEYMFSIAVRSNKNNAEAVKEALLAVVPHCFGDHGSCNVKWCGYLVDPTTFIHKHLPGKKPLSGESIRAGLNAVFSTYAALADQLAPLGSSEVNESFNMVVSSKHSKRLHYGRSESMAFRVGAAVCQMNEATSYITEVNKELEVSPGENTARFRASKDRRREKHAARSRTQLFKTNRITKKKKRRLARLQAENKEGVTYASGCGFAVTPVDSECDGIVPLPDEFLNETQNLQLNTVDSKDIAFVVFDVETTGLGKTCQVVQLAAVHSGRNFSRYIMPSKDFDVGATQATGLSLSDGRLLLHGTPVPTTNPKQAYTDFLAFLDSLGSKVVLIAHNGWRVDAPNISKELQELKLWDLFKRTVIGFGDTMPLFRKKLASNKPPSFTQSALAEYYKVPNPEAHNAVCDCEVLDAILTAANVPDCEMKTFSKPVDFKAREDLEKHRKADVVKTYKTFTAVKSVTLNWLAAAGIRFEQLRQMFSDGGADQVRSFLEENVDGKPRITKSKPVINRIIDGLSNL